MISWWELRRIRYCGLSRWKSMRAEFSELRDLGKNSFNGLADKDRGYTLAEVLAGLSIGVIFLTIAIGFLFQHNQFWDSYADMNMNQRMLDGIISYTEQRIIWAEQIWISGGFAESMDHTISFGQDGRIRIDGALIYPELFYNGKRVYCRASLMKGKEPALSLYWTLEDEQGNVAAAGETCMEFPNIQMPECLAIDQEILDSHKGYLYFHYRCPRF